MQEAYIILVVLAILFFPITILYGLIFALDKLYYLLYHKKIEKGGWTLYK